MLILIKLILVKKHLEWWFWSGGSHETPLGCGALLATSLWILSTWKLQIMKLQIAAESILVIWQHVLDNVIKTREVNKAQKQEMYTLHCTRAFPCLTTMAAFSLTLNQQPMPAFVFVIPPPLFPLLSICQLECKGAVWSENIKGTPRCSCSSFLCSHQENDLSLTDRLLRYIQTDQRRPLEATKPPLDWREKPRSIGTLSGCTHSE